MEKKDNLITYLALEVTWILANIFTLVDAVSNEYLFSDYTCKTTSVLFLLLNKFLESGNIRLRNLTLEAVLNAISDNKAAAAAFVDEGILF